MTGGVGEVRVGPRRFALSRGQILHVPWAAPVKYRAAARDPFVLIGVHFKYLPWSAQATPPLHSSRKVDTSRASMQEPPVPQPFAEPFVIAPPPQSRAIDVAIEIANAFERDRASGSNPDREAHLRALGLEFLLLMRACVRGAPQGGMHAQAHVVAELISWMGLAFRRPMRRGDLARRAGMSESSLAAAFQAVTGRAPIPNYLIELAVGARAHDAEHEPAAHRRDRGVGRNSRRHAIFSKLFKRRARECRRWNIASSAGCNCARE